MPVLRSQLFTTGTPDVVAKLEACATGTPNEIVSHFTTNHPLSRGEHVRRLQLALKHVQDTHASLAIPTFAINGVYDAEFARAVLAYKTARQIFNFAGAIDPIIGKKTIRSLDSENIDRPHHSLTWPVSPHSYPRPASIPEPGPVPDHKRIAGGIWLGPGHVTVRGGMSMTFLISNGNVLGASIKISDHLGQSHSAIVLPGQTIEMNFSNYGREPMGWDFEIISDSDAYVLHWQLWSTWAEGDAPSD